MGTRHLICVVKDKDYKVAQYGQWDGYPGGQGLTVLNFLKKINRELFERKVADLSWITEEEFKVAELHAEMYPENNRDTSAKILPLIQDSDRPIKLVNQLKFAGDSLFCEWVYVIDLDKNTFEVYEGFNEEPLQNYERFRMFEKRNESIELDGQVIIQSRQNYYPVKLVKSFELNNLPSSDEFLSFFKYDEE